MSALLKRFWTDHRLASVISLALLFLGLLIKPWTLVLVLAVAFGGPLLQRLESFSTSPFAGWRRSNWVALALLVGAALLALTGKSGGQGALILALLPVAWVLVTDRGILKSGTSVDSTPSARTVIASAPTTPEGTEMQDVCQKLWRAFVEDESLVVSSYEDEEIDPLEGPEGYEEGDECPRIYLLCDGSDGTTAEIRLLQDQTFCDEDTEFLGLADDYEGFEDLFEKFLRNGGRLSDCIALLSPKASDAIGRANDESDADSATGSIEHESITRLVGQELIDKIRELGDVGKSDLVRACGYVSTKQDGGERLNFTAFYEALLEAKGAEVSISSSDAEDEEEESSSKRETADLPSEWQDLDGSEIVDRLRDSDDIDTDILSALASSDDWEVRRAVAWHDNTPDEVLETLADDDDSDVSQATRERSLPKAWRFMSQDEKVEALKSKDVSPEIIDILASSENWSLRQAVAWSPSTSESILEQLKKDDDDDVKEAATTERRLPLEWRFLNNWDKVERLGKETADLAILDILAKSRASDVRRAVALHPPTPERLLSVLREDDDESVQSGVRERDLPDSWKSLDDEERISALKSDDVPESVLLILARSNSWTIRQAVALSPGTPDEILERLSGDDDTDVQSAVRERGLPEDWKQLDEDEKVEKLNESPAEGNVLKILARSGRWSIRQAVAQNPGASEELLKALLNDDDDDVKRAAKKSLKRMGSSPTNGDSTTPWKELFAADDDQDNFERSPFENIPYLIEGLDSGEKLVLANLGVIEEECEEFLIEFSEETKAMLPPDCKVENGKHTAVYVRHGKARVVLGWKTPQDRDSLLADLRKDWADAKVNGEKCFDESLKPTLTDFGSTSTSATSVLVLKNDQTWHSLDPEEVEWNDREETCLDDERGTGFYSNFFESREAHPYQVAMISKVGDGYVVEEIQESELPEFKEWIISRLDADPALPPSNPRDEEADSEEDEEHSIYIKTEPGGSIRFGALDSDQIALLKSCITAQELTGELSEIGDNSSGQLNECDGVVNSGDEGDFGNEGTIVYSADQPALGPDRSDDGTFKDGIYVVLMRLSKCSIEFEFTATGGFDENEFEEISVPVCLPEEIVHGLYGHPDFNIITGFRFRGESVEEYEGEVEDRGYDDQLTFFAIKDGVTTILYSNYNGDEEWCDADEAKGLMSSFL